MKRKRKPIKKHEHKLKFDSVEKVLFIILIFSGIVLIYIMFGGR
jgi:hypothetical protein